MNMVLRVVGIIQIGVVTAFLIYSMLTGAEMGYAVAVGAILGVSCLILAEL